MSAALHEVEVQREVEVVAVHRRALQIAAALGFDKFEQTRIATAVSEIVRNAVEYADGARVRFSVEGERPQSLVIEVEDHGPGIVDVRAALSGRPSKTGLGLGLPGARRLMDRFEVDTSPQGTTVRLAKRLPRRAAPVGALQLGQLAVSLGQVSASNPAAEVRHLSAELVKRDEQLSALRRELDDTNRGVLTLYAELDARAEYQRQAIELKTRLMSDLGHELRTPLDSIVTIARFLLDRLDGPLTPEQERAVRIMHQTSRELMEFVNDLLDLAKAESGRAKVVPSDFTVADLFAALRGLLRPLASNPNVALVFEDASALPPLWTDEQKLSQVLRNFISNALKFTERGEVRVRAISGPDDTLLLSVSDTGIGISAHDQARIFEEFVQIEGPLQRKVKGTGLGLALTRRLVTLLGGMVDVVSEPGVGSTFSATVPRIYRPTEEAPAQAPEATSAPARLGPPPTILIIDDDEASRYVLRRYLEGRFRVVEATSGREGLRSARADRPDAVFLDLAMPDLTGYETLAALKGDGATTAIPVVVYTAQPVGDEERERLQQAAAIVEKSTGSKERDLSALEGALRGAGLLATEH